MAKGKQYSYQDFGDRPSLGVLWRTNHGSILLIVTTLILVVGGIVLLIPAPPLPLRTVLNLQGLSSADNSDNETGEDSENAEVADTAVLRIVVEGLDSDRGVVRIAMYSDQNSFNDPDLADEKAAVEIEEGKAIWEINVPVGQSIAISAFHDQNDDGKLDKNLFGIPVEKYGFSLGTRSPRGPPPFSETSFKPEPGVTEVPVLIW